MGKGGQASASTSRPSTAGDITSARVEHQPLVTRASPGRGSTGSRLAVTESEITAQGVSSNLMFQLHAFVAREFRLHDCKVADVAAYEALPLHKKKRVLAVVSKHTYAIDTFIASRAFSKSECDTLRGWKAAVPELFAHGAEDAMVDARMMVDARGKVNWLGGTKMNIPVPM